MGRGIIQVSDTLFWESVKDLEGNVISEGEGPIKQPQTLAEWRALLMLPDEFSLLEAKIDPMYPYWNVTVESELIPSVDGKTLNVDPIYCVQYEGEIRTHYLDRIEVYTSERKAIWQRSEQ